MPTSYRMWCHNSSCPVSNNWGEESPRNCPHCGQPMQEFPTAEQAAAIRRPRDTSTY